MKKEELEALELKLRKAGLTEEQIRLALDPLEAYVYKYEDLIE